MADMAEISQVEACWEALERLGLAGETIPLTYMNSTAAIKAFCGEHGGLVCTSSNARAAFDWAFARGKRILFLPDQHLGRNTGYAMGIPLEEMAVWDPWAIQIGPNQGGQTKQSLAASRVLLWKGHCAVHQRFLPGHVDQVRAKYPGIQVIVHPECRWEVCQKADALGSTEQLIALVEQAPAGSIFAIGTEIHLVNRLARRFAPKAKKSSPSTIPVASAPPCTASALSTWPGLSKTWSKAASSTASRCARREALGQGCAGQDAGGGVKAGVSYRDQRSQLESYFDQANADHASVRDCGRASDFEYKQHEPHLATAADPCSLLFSRIL